MGLTIGEWLEALFWLDLVAGLGLILACCAVCGRLRQVQLSLRNVDLALQRLLPPAQDAPCPNGLAVPANGSQPAAERMLGCHRLRLPPPAKNGTQALVVRRSTALPVARRNPPARPATRTRRRNRQA